MMVTPNGSGSLIEIPVVQWAWDTSRDRWAREPQDVCRLTDAASLVELAEPDRQGRRFVLLLGEYDAPRARRVAVGFGEVLGFVTMFDEVDELRRAHNAAARGMRYASGRAVEALIQLIRDTHRASAATPEELTERESDIMRCISDQLTVKATSRLLGISIKTVEAHRRSAFRKLGVRNAVDAVSTYSKRQSQLLVDSRHES